MTKPRSAVNKAIIGGKRKDRMHLIPVTVLTFLKLARMERRYFADRPITELGARCMLAEARRNRASHSRFTKKGADRAWKWRPRSGGVPPKVGAGRVEELYRVRQAAAAVS